MNGAALPLLHLERIRQRYPIVLHGVGLNLLGEAPLDEAYLDRLVRLADAVDAPFVTDHLCWTGAHGRSHHDLLPTPYVPELVDAWVRGYRAVAPLTAQDEAELPTFIMLRRLLLVAWIGSHSSTETAQAMGEEYTATSCRLAEHYLGTMAI